MFSTDQIESNDNTLLFSILLMLAALYLVFKNIIFIFRLPIIRDVVFIISVLQINARVTPRRPYTSDISNLITIGGLPQDPQSWFAKDKSLKNRLLTRDNPKYGLVVSMLEKHEREGNALYFINGKPPVQEYEWRAHGIDYFNCPMQDLTTNIDIRLACEAIDKMIACILHGKAVYIHCQAGEGRAFTLLMAFLAIYGKPYQTDDGKIHFKQFNNYEAALNEVKASRPQVWASEKRREKIFEIMMAYKTNNPLPHQQADASIFQDSTNTLQNGVLYAR